MPTLREQLVEVWRQSLVESRETVDLPGGPIRLGRTRSLGLRTVAFSYEGAVIEGIEQNPEKASRWAKLAQEGKRIMQFRAKGRYFANVCDGIVTRYPAWSGLGLPE